MLNVSFAIIILLFVLLAIGGGMIFLQIFLSKKESKWLGLILPVICFVNSLLILLAVIANALYLGEMIIIMLTQFLLFNIPTAILLAIYAACRATVRSNKAIDKMNIQDLE